MKEIYLDNSATTALCDAAKAKMTEAMEHYGNPSSLHPVGVYAHNLLEEARRNLAVTFGVRGRIEPGQVIFTSCGSEADNLALFGTAHAKERRRGGRIISTDSEHPGVENVLAALEREGFDVVRIPTRGGVLDFGAYEAALNDKTFLVTMMTVNNETGARYDIGRAFAMAKAKNPAILTHTDAVQGYLKCKFTPASVMADMVTVSGHKIHAPKGVGALYLSPEVLKRRDVITVLLGGGQEAGFRSGTENMVGIAGFGAAAAEGWRTLDASIAYMTDLRNYTEARLAELPVRLTIPAGERSPHILNFVLPEIRSETMLHELSKSGICVSAGSACSSHSAHPSASLTAFGLSPREIECSIRVSFSVYNTRDDADALVAALADACGRLVKIRR